jgi:hypothetical protein
MRAEWWSQRFAPEGSTAGEGLGKQLGLSSLDPLTVLVREAAQNSWDARRDDVTSVKFRISLRQLGTSSDAWRRHLLPGPDSRAAVALDHNLHADTTILVISDRGTVGLGGPLRASHRATGPEKPDFVQFLRNVGEPRDHDYGGGTYGFGKGIFFQLSAASMIMVDTQTENGAADGRRLMGAALGQSWYDTDDRRFTGRHWWGEEVDGIPDPLTGPAAARVSQELGLPGFGNGSGTNIVIVGAQLGSAWHDDTGLPRDREKAAIFIASSMLWHLWPKMTPDEDSQRMDFAVDVDGKNIEVPTPDVVDEIRPFSVALNRIRAGDKESYRRTVAPKDAGSFAAELVAASLGGRTSAVVAAARAFTGAAHHVARMRAVELVVDYLAGPEHVDPLFGYAGVFRASKDADTYFAGAEPPTHDDWVEKGLSGTARGVVQGSRRFIHKQLEPFTTRPSTADGSATDLGLGPLALRLSGIVPGGILADRPLRVLTNPVDAAPDDGECDGPAAPVRPGSGPGVAPAAAAGGVDGHDSQLGVAGGSTDADRPDSRADGNAAAGHPAGGAGRADGPDGTAASWHPDVAAGDHGAAGSVDDAALPPVPPARRTGRRPRLIGAPFLGFDEGTPYVIARVQIPAVPYERQVEAEAGVVVEGGGLEAEAPLGARSPTVCGWRNVDRGIVREGATLTVEPDDGGEWWVYADFVPDAVVRIRIKLLESRHGR